MNIMCSACEISKPPSDFYGSPKKQGKCKGCVSLYNESRKEIRYNNHKQWVANNRERCVELCKRSTQRSRPDRNTLIDEAKNRPCADCAVQHPPAAMDFDHLPGTKKKAKLSHFRRIGYSIETIRSEIAKCEVVCANCHRTRTHERRVASRTATPSYDIVCMRRLQEWVVGMKSAPCAICSQARSPWQMDFDHIDPTSKTEAVSELVRRRAAKSKILEEIRKCQLVCANCHRIKSHAQV